MTSPGEDPDADAAPEAEPRDARRRRQLIDATITSIAENGLSGTTVAKVAELAGLSAGIVNFYFRTKDALLLATLNHVDSEFARRQEEAARLAGDDPVRLLESMVEVEFDPDVCNPRWTAVWNAFWGEARAREDYMRVCGRREEAQERQIMELFRKIAEAGGHAHLDPIALGRAFYHLLSSLPENALGRPEPFDFDDAKQTCRGFLTSIFPDEFDAAATGIRPDGDRAEKTRPAPDSRWTTLPTWVYHDPEFCALEQEYIFRRHWLLIGHASEVPNTGDYVTLDVGNDRVFVIRGRDGRLRAFDNVCRHRASRVVTGDAGSCSNAIVCPYHGWSYRFDGRLRGVPAEGSFAGLDKSTVRLPELELEEWMGFVFVRFGGDTPSVHDQMADYEVEASQYRFEDMRPWRPRTILDCDFNWKLFAENDAEGYHVPVGHPGLRRLFGDSYVECVSDAGGSRAYSMLEANESSVWSERMYQRILPDVATLPTELRRAWVYYSLFPGAVLQVGPDVVDCYQLLPFGPDRCRILGFRVAHADASREMRAARYLSHRIVRQVVQEDLRFCAWTDSGVRSSRYRGGFLSQREAGVKDFQDHIRKVIPVANIPERPPAGRMAEHNEELRARC